jgi:hypothetical protein
MNEEHIRHAARLRQLMTDLSSIADDLAKARATYIARGYDQAISNESLGPGVVNANDVLGMIYVTADLETFLNADRRTLIAKVRTDY